MRLGVGRHHGRAGRERVGRPSGRGLTTERGDQLGIELGREQRRGPGDRPHGRDGQRVRVARPESDDGDRDQHRLGTRPSQGVAGADVDVGVTLTVGAVTVVPLVDAGAVVVAVVLPVAVALVVVAAAVVVVAGVAGATFGLRYFARSCCFFTTVSRHFWTAAARFTSSSCLTIWSLTSANGLGAGLDVAQEMMCQPNWVFTGCGDLAGLEREGGLLELGHELALPDRAEVAARLFAAGVGRLPRARAAAKFAGVTSARIASASAFVATRMCEQALLGRAA